jgi:hypothetical protein
MSYILRRRRLGRTSAREIARESTTNLKVYRNDGKAYNHATNKYTTAALPSDAEYVFRWGCTSSVPGNPTIVNTSAAIHTVADKAQFRMDTAALGIAPKSWRSYHDLEGSEDHLTEYTKLVVRRSTHHQGLFLHVATNEQELKAACNRYGEGNYYISEYIAKVAEYRVCFVSGRVAWVAKKTPADPNAVAWNVAQGGRFDNVAWGDWPLKAIKVSKQAFDLSGLDFGGVDVMVDNAGEVFVLEINSAPSLTSPYRQSCMTKCFDYIVQNGKAAIPLVESLGNYKKFIHPALTAEALVLAQAA